jgi:hypothetical protein
MPSKCLRRLIATFDQPNHHRRCAWQAKKKYTEQDVYVPWHLKSQYHDSKPAARPPKPRKLGRKARVQQQRKQQQQQHELEDADDQQPPVPPSGAAIEPPAPVPAPPTSSSSSTNTSSSSSTNTSTNTINSSTPTPTGEAFTTRPVRGAAHVMQGIERDVTHDKYRVYQR